MEEHMPAPSGNQRITDRVHVFASSGWFCQPLRDRWVLTLSPRMPGICFSSVAFFLLSMGNSPFQAGWATTFRLNKAGKAALMASLNALAVAKEHLGDLDRLKKLLKLTVLIATTEQFTEHATVADGASNLSVQIFGPNAGHVRLVYGVQSLPIGAPLVVDTVFEIEPMSYTHILFH